MRRRSVGTVGGRPDAGAGPRSDPGGPRRGPVSSDPTTPGFSSADAALDEFDSAAEVDAAFRTQRRIAVGYFVVFLIVTLAVPTLSLVLSWWSNARVVGGMSPSFVFAAAGLYVFFFLLGIAAVTLSDAVEDRMLGVTDEPSDGETMP